MPTVAKLAAAVGLLATLTSGCDHRNCASGEGSIAGDARAGAQTPRAALQKVLDDPPPHLSTTGWHLDRQEGGLVTYKSGHEEVELTQLSDGTWTRSSYTACS